MERPLHGLNKAFGKGLLNAFGGPYRRPWGHLGAILGPSWGRLGPSWGHLGAVLAHLGAVLEPSWGHLEPFLALEGWSQ